MTKLAGYRCPATDIDTFTLETAMRRCIHLERTTALDPIAEWCEQHQGWHVIEEELHVGAWEPQRVVEVPAGDHLAIEHRTDPMPLVLSCVAIACSVAALVLR